MVLTSRRDLVQVANWLRENVEPIEDAVRGPVYRAAAQLMDGTYLPCVRFLNPEKSVHYSTPRFEEARKTGGMDYNVLLETFVTGQHGVNCWDIARVEKSRFAIPAPLRNRIYSAGETRMHWTSFVGKMSDGTKHCFDCFDHVEFFEMPAGYTAEQLVDVFPHQVTEGKRYHELPFRGCALDIL
jgi:hypothetical protein